MTISATYLGDLSRVRVSFTGLDSAADYAIVERSTDGITWTTVRGGDRVAVSGGAGKIDDYEFVAGVVNTYRMTAIDSAPTTWIGSGGPVTNNNASLNPATHANTAVGDLVLLFATIRNSGAGSPNLPAGGGWSTLVDMGNVRLFGRYATAAGSQVHAVTFSGGVANADTTAQCTTFRNASITPAGSPATQTNASSQNISWPGSTPGVAGTQAVFLGWKQDDWSSAPVPGYTLDSELGQVASTAGDDAGHVWWRRTKTSTAIQPAGSWTITGGASAISKAALLFLSPRPNVGVETTTITPTLASTWIKNPSRPALNTTVTVTNISDVSRKARSGTFDVIGRTMPVVVSDVMSSRALSITLMVSGLEEANELDGRLAAGDPVFIQAPTANAAVPTLYATVTGYKVRKTAMRGLRRFFDLDLIEVAAPASTVYGDTYVYADVVNDFASYNDVLANVTDYFQLIDRVSTSSVIVP